jgi:hypothetical protein
MKPLKIIPGRTLRERVAASVAILAGCAAVAWVMINGLAYGSEGDAPPQLWTSGRFEPPTIFRVLNALIGVCAFSLLLFRYFRFRDNLREGAAQQCAPPNGGLAAPPGNSGVTEGPPSVS